jgi:hypothetical protein
MGDVQIAGEEGGRKEEEKQDKQQSRRWQGNERKRAWQEKTANGNRVTVYAVVAHTERMA